MATRHSGHFAHAAATALSQGNEPRQRLAAWRAVIQLAENELPCKADTSYTACGPGCGTCCSINVSILEPEALGIADFISTNFTPADLEQLLLSLEILHRDTRWLDDEERMMVRRSCAFLDPQQNCSIHPVRPLMCRSITSTDPGRCRDAIAMLALGEPPQVICNLEQKQLFEAAYLGFASALQQNQCDDSSYRLAGLLFDHLVNKKGRPQLDGP